MKKFISYQKLSKKDRRLHDLQQRKTWGPTNPATRRSPSSSAYKRKKSQRSPDEGDAGSF